MTGAATPGATHETSVSPSDPAIADAGPVDVTVRYWAAIKAVAGLAEETVSAVTVADVLAEIRARHAATSRFLDVLGVCAVLVDERPLGGRDPASVGVQAGTVVDLLPPFAGG